MQAAPDSWGRGEGGGGEFTYSKIWKSRNTENRFRPFFHWYIVDLQSYQFPVYSIVIQYFYRLHYKTTAHFTHCSNYCTTALISHASRVMLKILQARLQQFMNQELSDIQAGLRKSRGTRDQIDNIHWIIEKAREFQKNPYFCFIDYAKAFDCVDHNKLWKILKEMGIPDHLTCLLQNLYAVPEATIRARYVTDWFQIGKGVQQGVYCHPAYLS